MTAGVGTPTHMVCCSQRLAIVHDYSFALHACRPRSLHMCAIITSYGALRGIAHGTAWHGMAHGTTWRMARHGTAWRVQAPEVLAGQPIELPYAVDSYSFGILAWYVCSGSGVGVGGSGGSDSGGGSATPPPPHTHTHTHTWCIICARCTELYWNISV
jgi:hypothetical protein